MAGASISTPICAAPLRIQSIWLLRIGCGMYATVSGVLPWAAAGSAPSAAVPATPAPTVVRKLRRFTSLMRASLVAWLRARSHHARLAQATNGVVGVPVLLQDLLAVLPGRRLRPAHHGAPRGELHREA